MAIAIGPLEEGQTTIKFCWDTHGFRRRPPPVELVHSELLIESGTYQGSVCRLPSCQQSFGIVRVFSRHFLSRFSALLEHQFYVSLRVSWPMPACTPAVFLRCFRNAQARALGGSEWASGGISDAAESTSKLLSERHRGAVVVIATDGVWGPLARTRHPAAAATGAGARVGARARVGTRARVGAGAGAANAGAGGGERTGGRLNVLPAIDAAPVESEAVRSEQAVWLVSEARDGGLSAGEAAERVVESALASGGNDNAACVVLYL
eukprot:6213917-Pleurochrysis_carterae.AAC.1